MPCKALTAQADWKYCSIKMKDGGQYAFELQVLDAGANALVAGSAVYAHFFLATFLPEPYQKFPSFI